MNSKKAEGTPTGPSRQRHYNTTITTPSKSDMPNRDLYQSVQPSFNPSSPSRPLNNMTTDSSFIACDPEKEPIKAYLRVRPPPANYDSDTQRPYLQIVSDVEVSMTPPENSNAYRTRNRAPERYKFTKTFPETATQKEFFNQTTLPLVKDVLDGENALIFAYGVTNSGKTYSTMGTKTDTGLLPRSLDVIFNSIAQNQSDSRIKPMMHSLVQAYSDPAEENRDILQHAAHRDALSHADSIHTKWSPSEMPLERDNTIIPIDPNYEYGVWVSFAEVYTEKIYDLLVRPNKENKRQSLPLKYEYRSGHKYIDGLKEVRIHSIEEAYIILNEGQHNRSVYSTLMNHKSSRSHSIFTIRIVRVPIDEEDYVIDDPSYATVSKMSIVDLAGSERYKSTLNSGQRLKEAGNINKSLMVLGQCMETIRLNQIKSELGKHTAIVPFRHSKLTELFKSSFEGDGKAVMVVNVNPFDTGFDENSRVMKFAAVAKDVATWRRAHPKFDLRGVSSSVRRTRTKMPEKKPLRETMMELPALEDLEISRVTDEDDDDDEGNDDPFVDSLIRQLDDLREKWIDAEARCATMESNIRQQVAKESEAELRKMENMFMTALKRENDVNKLEIEERRGSNQSGAESFLKENSLTLLHERQTALTAELDALRDRLNDHETTKRSLLEKIAELENEKWKEQENGRRLLQQVRERDRTIEELTRQLKSKEASPELPKADSPSNVKQNTVSDTMELDDQDSQKQKRASCVMDEKFERFLDLRKRLRRSIFRGEEYSQDADFILRDVEEMKGVTFEMVKQTNMGRLLKLIAQREFRNDPCNIKERATNLFKRYAQLSIPVLAQSTQQNPRQPLKTVVISVDAGKEEELISEMRVALESLHHENIKLKNRVRAMQEGQRRLKAAFNKTKDMSQDMMTAVSDHSIKEALATEITEAPVSAVEENEENDLHQDSLPIPPNLGAQFPDNGLDLASTEDKDMDADELGLSDQNRRPKRRRRLRARQ